MMNLTDIAEAQDVSMEEVCKLNHQFAMALYKPYIDNKAMVLPSYTVERLARILTWDYLKKEKQK